MFAVYAFCRQADDAIDRYQDIVKLNELEHGLRQMALRKGSGYPFMAGSFCCLCEI